MSGQENQPYNGQIDETLLTAYALDELEGPERALVEAALKSDTKATKAVEEIRAVADCLRDAAGEDDSHAPSATLRETIENRLEAAFPAVVRPGDLEPIQKLSETRAIPDRGRHSPWFPDRFLKAAPATGPSPRRRRRAILALAAAAALLAAVAIPSLPMFNGGVESPLALGPARMSESTESTADDVSDAEGVETSLAGQPEYGDEYGATQPDGHGGGYGSEGDGMGVMGGMTLSVEKAGQPAESSIPTRRPGESYEGLVGKAGAGYAAKATDAPADPFDHSPPPMTQPKRSAFMGQRNMPQKPAAQQEATTAARAPAWSQSQAVGPAATPVPYPTAPPAGPSQVAGVQTPVVTSGRGMSGAGYAPRYAPPTAPTAPPVPANQLPSRPNALAGQSYGGTGGYGGYAGGYAGGYSEEYGGGYGETPDFQQRARDVQPAPNQREGWGRSHDQAAGEFGTNRGTEQYAPFVENSFQSPVTMPESTVSADVDTASYANVRRFLNNRQAPPPAAVRIEEMVNYFRYDYARPDDETPFAVDVETASCPWNDANRLVRIGLKAEDIDAAERGPSNLVFLLDVSGSMRDANKLPLVKDAMAMLVDQLTEDDRVSIVTYAGQAGVALEPTEDTKRNKIIDRIEALTAGGSTHGSAGIQMAYDQAMANFVPQGNNRVILCTDGDLNVGITDDNELVELIQQQASGGVFLTVVGVGTGNLKDAKLEQLADKGNGSYAYVDGLREAKKVFVEQAAGSLVTVAKDVKIQIEFNPAEVSAYRLIGYENRLLATEDFGDDMKDAGEIGAGHSVTFFYEIVPTNLPVGQIAVLNNLNNTTNLRYQRIMSNALNEAATSGELLTLKLRYKLPDEQESTLLELPVEDDGKRFGEASSEFRFAAAVASFGLLLRGSQYNQGLTFSAVEEFAAGATDEDPHGLRSEFVGLVRQARSIYGEALPLARQADMLPAAATSEMLPAEAAPVPAPAER